MGVVYSFYLEDCNGTVVKEELGHHIHVMLQLINLPVNVKSFLQRIGIEEKVYTQALKISIVFHDIGKAYYQANYRKSPCKHNGKQRRYLSFIGHEFLSACILHQVLKDPYTIEIGSSQWESDFDFIKGAMLYAVLYHHHAMAYLERKEEILYGRNTRIKQPSKDQIEYLTSITMKTLGRKTSSNLKETLTTKPPNIIVTKNCLENIHKKINLPWNRNPNETPKHTPFTLQRLLLTYLLVLDNIAATQARNPRKQTLYLKAIKLFKQNYL